MRECPSKGGVGIVQPTGSVVGSSSSVRPSGQVPQTSARRDRGRSGTSSLSGPQHRVYTLAGRQDRESSPDVVIGILSVSSYDAYVLIDPGRDENANQAKIPSSHSSQRQEFDVNDLKADPAERTPIFYYHPNIRDEKDIVSACKIETIEAIIEDLNGDYFALLVDESKDVSCKEQMAICFRYADKRGFVMEAFIGLVHVKDTSALSLKKAIVDVLTHHSFTLSYVRGQCYDGASNMQGELGGLKTLIKQESRSAHSVRCFAHQLQLTLVAVSKKCVQVGELVLLVSNVLNVLGASFKCVDGFRESQKQKLREALDMGELETGRGLNQELGLIKVGDTNWGSHYKSFGNFITNFASIVDVLDALVVNASTLDERASASGFLRSCQTFETVFLLHLMTDVLGITYDLNVSLQKKEQDIANAMILVKVCKRRLQALRDNEWDPLLEKHSGWDSLKEKVETFCIKHKISLPNYDDPYTNSGRSRRKVVDYTTLHHYRVDLFYKIIDWQLQELNERFNEVTSDLLNGVACLNPIDSFSSFDIKKIVRMAELYPDDFDGFSMRTLENQLANYIINVRDIDKRFSNLGGLGEFSRNLLSFYQSPLQQLKELFRR
ncbi:uncharacterized protein LOC132039491 [Lycium ferocissimum]|uniref:uncharacterized protein LOC132039491 n=1 Tax=Lycium ferocissimum TaxID=112874 RepID=UPI002815F12E|nr:uncharacterized protein LOC132039491 [Lycium ferocissimum]